MGERKPARPVGQIYRVIDRQRKALLNREQKTVDAMLRGWRAAALHIEERLAKVTELIENSRAHDLPIGESWLYEQERWLTFLETIAEEMGKLVPELQDEARRGQLSAIDMGLQHAGELQKALTTRRAFRSLPVAAVRSAVGVISDRSPVADLFRELGPDMLRKARAIFVSGVASGENPKEIARRWREEGIDLSKKRSVLIARTESLRAYRTSQQETYASNSDILVGCRVVCARDGRSCVMCLAQDGKILAHREQFATHPGCRCGLAPVLIDDDAARELPDAWLRKQPPDVQRRFLGKARYDLWQSGKVGLHDLLEFPVDSKWGRQVRLKRLDRLGADIAAGRKPVPPNVRVVNGVPMPADKDPFSGGATRALDVQVTDTNTRARILEAMEEIDKIHGPGALDGRALPVVESEHEGSYGYLEGAMPGEPSVRMGISTDGDHIGLTMVHEFGHFLDRDDLIDFRDFKIAPLDDAFPADVAAALTSEQVKAIEDFYDALDQTDEIHAIAAVALRHPHPGARGYAAEMLMTVEVWARAYAQYIATKSGNTALLRDLAAVRAKYVSGDDLPRQWADDAFEGVGAAVEKILKAFGVMKP